MVREAYNGTRRQWATRSLDTSASTPLDPRIKHMAGFGVTLTFGRHRVGRRTDLTPSCLKSAQKRTMPTVERRIKAMAESARIAAARLAKPVLGVVESPSPWFRRRTLQIVWVAAAVGLVLGISTAIYHLTTDPLADVRAYYEAGARLNAGQPLYFGTGNLNVQDQYVYPPLLAIVFRPLALFPFEVVGPLWGLGMIGAFVLTVRRIGISRKTWLALGLLAAPIGWALSVSQAQSLVTLLLAFGTPAAIALAANLKLFPVLMVLYWLGRREWRAVITLVVWGVALLAIQFVLEPTGTTAYFNYLSLAQVRGVYNISPYAFSPLLWGVLALVSAIAVLVLARTRFGWAAAIGFSTLVMPRLLFYHFMSLLPALRSPDEPPQGQAGATSEVLAAADPDGRPVY